MQHLERLFEDSALKCPSVFDSATTIEYFGYERGGRVLTPWTPPTWIRLCMMTFVRKCETFLEKIRKL